MLIFELDKDYSLLEIIRTFDLKPEMDKFNNEFNITGSFYHKGFIAAVALKTDVVVFQLTLGTVLYYIEKIADFGIVFTEEIIDSMFEMQVFLRTDKDLAELKDKMLKYFEGTEEYETCSYILNKYNNIKNG